MYASSSRDLHLFAIVSISSPLDVPPVLVMSLVHVILFVPAGNTIAKDSVGSAPTSQSPATNAKKSIHVDIEMAGTGKLVARGVVVDVSSTVGSLRARLAKRCFGKAAWQVRMFLDHECSAELRVGVDDKQLSSIANGVVDGGTIVVLKREQWRECATGFMGSDKGQLVFCLLFGWSCVCASHSYIPFSRGS